LPKFWLLGTRLRLNWDAQNYASKQVKLGCLHAEQAL
jgi:hypothetical protein